MLLLSVLLLCPLLAQAARMNVLHSWSLVDFVFPSDADREESIASGKFVPKYAVILDVEFWEGSESSDAKTFVTLPRLLGGSPATLATVTDQVSNNTTLLQPYPDWSWHQGDCDGIISVFRTAVDKCGRLWVLDAGVNASFITSERQCPPQILVFDLETDTLITRGCIAIAYGLERMAGEERIEWDSAKLERLGSRTEGSMPADIEVAINFGRHRLSDSVLKFDSLLINIVVDTRDECNASFAYAADCSSNGLVVYDFAEDQSWRVSSPLFFPHPLHGDFKINGVEFQVMDGLIGLALGPVVNGDRVLYFHALATWLENWVLTSVLRNSSTASSDTTAFHALPESRKAAVTTEAVTAQGVMLFALPELNAIGCWNTRTPYSYTTQDIVAKDDVTLQFQSGLKIYGNQVWTLSCRLQNYMVGNVSESEINMRINVGSVSDLIKNTKCCSTGNSQMNPLKWISNIFSGDKTVV